MVSRPGPLRQTSPAAEADSEADVARRRFDPPVLRLRWRTPSRQTRAGFLADGRARTGWSPEVWERMLFHGGLHLDGRPHAAGELPAELPAGVQVDAYAFAWEPQPIAIAAERILCDRGGLLAFDKPAWLPVQGTRASRRLSLEAALRELTGCASLVAVHRLDRETSGVTLFARDARTAARLGRAFAAGQLRKRYLALVGPPPRQACWEVSGWLGRVLHPSRYAFGLADSPRPGWRASRTRFALLARAGARALVAAEPLTGRTHQIRVHLAASGAPILGDPVYAGAPAARLQLHAAELVLALDAGPLAIRAPLPADLEPGFVDFARLQLAARPTW